jgi:3-polyprenyl-4-hydroxybenzoate decarboxylase
MPYQDFRQFLDVLRQHGELIDINRPIDLSDVGKAIKQSYRRQGPGIVFNNNGTEFPLVGGPYITPGIVVSKDPETGGPDIGHYRFLVPSKDTFSFSAQPNHRFGKNLAKPRDLGGLYR